MHACIHAYMHTCIHAYIHTCIHAYIHTYIYIYTCIHAYMHTHINIHIHVHVHLHIHIHVHIHIHIHLHIHIHIHTYKYIYIHIGIYLYSYIFLYTYIRTYKHTCIHTYKYIYIHLCIYTYTHIYIYIYIHTYKHTYIHACMHTYIHTYVHTYIYTYIYVADYTVRSFLCWGLSSSMKSESLLVNQNDGMPESWGHQTCQWYRVESRSVVAMASLGLEPAWKNIKEGDQVDFLAELIIRDNTKRKHLVLSAVHRTFLTAAGSFKDDTVAVTILGGTIKMGKSGFHVGTASHFWEHSIPSSNSMKDGIEVCAGIGALGEGMMANGIKVHVANDIRESFTSLMQFQGFEATVTGDVGNHAVWAEIHAKHPTPAVLGAGFPCQPWSRLGDQKRSSDARALTLKSVILRCSFFLRCHTILLECVTEARKDKDVLKQLKEWCQVTKYNAREVILDLNQIWCTNRKRWWCLLTFPGSSPPALEPFPNLPDLITVGHPA